MVLFVKLLTYVTTVVGKFKLFAVFSSVVNVTLFCRPLVVLKTDAVFVVSESYVAICKVAVVVCVVVIAFVGSVVLTASIVVILTGML